MLFLKECTSLHSQSITMHLDMWSPLGVFKCFRRDPNVKHLEFCLNVSNYVCKTVLASIDAILHLKIIQCKVIDLSLVYSLHIDAVVIYFKLCWSTSATASCNSYLHSKKFKCLGN